MLLVEGPRQRWVFTPSVLTFKKFVGPDEGQILFSLTATHIFPNYSKSLKFW